MNIDDFKLICIHDKESNTWCVYPKNISGLVVQVDDIDDAPKELAKVFEAILKISFKKGWNEMIEYKKDNN